MGTSQTVRVAIAGASGVTGSSVVNALLSASGRFEIVALARPQSVTKPEYVAFTNRGVTIKAIEMSYASETLIDALRGFDVVISCMTLLQLKEEMALIDASSKAKAGVGRYVPSFFGPSCPPRGVMLAREMKEDLLDRIKRLYLPYTVIDVGWWYQLSLPSLPSGRIKAKEEYSTAKIIGNGDLPWAMTDNRDIGKYLANIIVDSRTLNRSVFCYSEVWSQNEVFDLLEQISGESVGRNYVTEDELLKVILKGKTALASGNLEPTSMMELGIAQYQYLLGIRGDDTPEHAKYLGYLDVKDLYPEVESTPLESYIKSALEGELKTVYS